MGKTSTASKDKYNAKAYDRLSIRVPKGEKDNLIAFAETNGKTLNGLVCELLEQALGRKFEKPKDL